MPSRFVRQELEKSIEKKCRLIAEERGGALIKTVALGKPGFPDRMLLMSGWGCFIEFKRPGGKPTDLQTHWMKVLERSKFRVHTIYSAEAFSQILDDHGARRT